MYINNQCWSIIENTQFVNIDIDNLSAGYWFFQESKNNLPA